MHIGTVIKMKRLRKEMKQGTLAKGICSIPHLSRIENGNSKPSEDILEMLSKKLGVVLVYEVDPIKPNLKVEMDKILERCINVINMRDQEGVSQLIDELAVLRQSTEFDARLSIDLDLTVLRLRLVQKRNAKDVLHEIRKYEKIESTLTPLQKFRVSMTLGIAYYGCGDVKSSLKAFSNASDLVGLTLVTSFERADFSYVQSVVLMADAQKSEALEKAKLSLPYFKSEMASLRAIECLLICGVAYKQLGQSERRLSISMKQSESVNGSR